MKKLVAAIATAFLVTLGFVAVSESPATAACPYSACINTTTNVSNTAVIKARRSLTIRVNVTAPGNVAPTGKVRVIVIKSNGKTKYDSTAPYLGGQESFTTQALHKGDYSITATYTPDAGSVFNGSSGSSSVHVVKPRHRK